MAVHLQIRRSTKTEWELANPILAYGEQGFETDTFQKKVGNGVTPWNDLPYSGNPAVQELGDSETETISQDRVTKELKALYNEAANFLIDYGTATSKYGGAPKIDYGNASTVPVDF